VSPTTDDPRCAGCGACCFTVGIPPFYRDGDEWKDLPEALRRDIEEFPIEANSLPTQPCIWLDLETLLCRHYQIRPQHCREFSVDGDGCRRYRELVQIDGVIGGV
jgi:Fe-S-cluster containining protein